MQTTEMEKLMKKIKFSVVEKKILRGLCIFVLIQLLIVVEFVYLFNSSGQIDIKDTKQVNVTVDSLRYFEGISKHSAGHIVIVSGSTKYYFMNRSTSDEYSVSKLCKALSKGDTLTIRYYETERLFLGKINLIVDARVGAEIYRSIEEYNQGHKGATLAVVIIFVVIELLFAAVLAFYTIINKNTMKSAKRKVFPKKNQRFD